MNRKMNTLATLLLLVGLLFMLPVTAVTEEAGDATITPASGTCGSNLTWTFDDKGVLTISGTGGMEDYYSCGPWGTEVKEVVIEKGVTSIGDFAFEGCSSLSKISIPDGVTSIGLWALHGCSSLGSINLPDSVTSFEPCTFGNCSRLSSITIPDGVTSISNGLFDGCSGLNSITIPDSVTSIGSSSFSGCSNLSSITIPDNVTAIGDYAFKGCSSLSNISIPDGVTNICDRTFFDCSSLSSISIPDNIISIGNYAFSGCSSLSNISIPDSVTSIGNSAFYDCSKLSSINIPEGVTNIAYGTFAYCSSLTSIRIPDSVTSIGDIAFRNCGSLSTINIPEDVTSIGAYAFAGCRSLSSIILPDNITSVGMNIIFNNYTVLYTSWNSTTAQTLTAAGYAWVDPSAAVASGTCGDNLTWTLDDEGVLTISGTGEMKNYYSYPAAPWGVEVKEVVIEEGVTSIGSNAFYGCSSLSSISIPDGVTSIGSDVFRYCSSLSSISIPDGVTSIGLRAFGDCPATLYANRNSFAAIALTNGGYPFIDPSYSELSLNAYETEDGTRTFTVARCPKDAVSVTFPAGVTGINGYAFRDCSNLSSISIPEGMTSIEIGTFYNCTNLSSISIPDSVTSIDIAAFYNCTNLTSITIPDGVTSIGSDTFRYCTALTSITIPDGVTTIGNNAFYACSRLSSIYLPNSVTSIGEYGFTPLYGQTTTVYCYEFSYAEEWALQNGFTVCLLDGKETEEYLQVTLPETFTLGLGETAALPLQVFPVLPEMSIVWTSADESVVQINEDGTITGAACGQAIVSVSVDGVTASCAVSIVAQATSLSLPDTIYVVAKQTRTLPLTIEPAGATVELVYETGNTIYASITEDSLLKGGAVGTTTLTVTDRLTGLTATANVRTTYPVTAVNFAPEACAVDPGETLQLTANVTMRTDSCVNELVTFASSDETIAVVDEKGLLTAKASGTVTITATAASGVSGSCTVLVLPAQRSVLPAGLVTIEDEALMGTPISFCVLPGSVSSIGVRAFASCTALKIIEIPAGVTIIAESAFDGCTDLIIVAPQGSAAHTFALNHGFVWMAK